MVGLFHDRVSGGFFYTSPWHEQLLGRTKQVLDLATPSPNAIAAEVLLALGRKEEALSTLKACLGWVQRMPTASGNFLGVLLQLLCELPEGVRLTSGIADHVEIALLPDVLTPDEDGWAHGEVVLMIPSGLHVNPNIAEPGLIATTLELVGLEGEAAFPDGREGRFEGNVSIPIRVKAVNMDAHFDLRVSFQACTESECRMPESRILTGLVKGTPMP